MESHSLNMYALLSSGVRGLNFGLSLRLCAFFVCKLWKQQRPWQDYVFVQAFAVHIIKPGHEISNNVVCATSKGSDQPALSHLNILRLLIY